MRLADILDERRILPHLQAKTKIGAIKEIIDAAARILPIPDTLALLQVILNQENIHSCRIEGDGAADPAAALVHARSNYCPSTLLGVGISRDGVPWVPSGRGPVRIVAVLVSPHWEVTTYVWAQGKLMRMLRQYEVRKALTGLASPDEAVRLLEGEPLEAERVNGVPGGGADRSRGISGAVS